METISGIDAAPAAQGAAIITDESIYAFRQHLREDEKSDATIDKYISCVRKLKNGLNGREISRDALIEYRDHIKKGLKAATVNGYLSAINSYLNSVVGGERSYSICLGFHKCWIRVPAILPCAVCHRL